MISAVGERSGLSLGVSLYQETCQIGQAAEKSAAALCPPVDNVYIQGVSAFKSADGYGGCKIGADEQLYSVSSQQFAELCEDVSA